MSEQGADIHFALGGAIFGELAPDAVETIAALGFPGLEPYRGLAMSYLERPGELKSLLDRHGITMVTCSNGAPGQSTNFIDPAARQRTIDDHVAFARDFLAVFGCRHFKINLGVRSGGGTSDDDLKAISSTADEIGKRTADLGIRLAAHPHIWGPVERPAEVHRLMELTNPGYVDLIVDTAQINLGGGDPLAMIATHYDRLAAIHWKDSRPEYRGWTGPTPTIEQHREKIVYQDLGSGGVDHPAIWRYLVDRGYRGWITLDLDPPRPNEGEGSVEDKLRINRRFLTDVLGLTAL